MNEHRPDSKSDFVYFVNSEIDREKLFQPVESTAKIFIGRENFEAALRYTTNGPQETLSVISLGSLGASAGTILTTLVTLQKAGCGVQFKHLDYHLVPLKEARKNIVTGYALQRLIDHVDAYLSVDNMIALG